MYEKSKVLTLTTVVSPRPRGETVSQSHILEPTINPCLFFQDACLERVKRRALESAKLFLSTDDRELR